MRVVVTGGTGVIGRAALASLLNAGHDVLALTRTHRSAAVATALGADVRRGDVLDPDTLVAAYEGADVAVNLASAVPVGRRGRRPGAWRAHDRLCTEGVANVVAAARACCVRRVVQESVSCLYADHGDEWVTESSRVDITAITEHVAAGEALVQDYTCGSRAGVVLRFAAIVGDDPITREKLRAAGRGRRIGLGHPADWAHVVHTDDLGPAVTAALHAPSGVYNVGAEPVRRHDLVRGYAEAAGVDSGRFLGPVGRRLAGLRVEPLSRSLRVSSDHFSAQTGWRPRRHTFDTSWLDLARTCVPA